VRDLVQPAEGRAAGVGVLQVDREMPHVRPERGLRRPPGDGQDVPPVRREVAHGGIAHQTARAGHQNRAHAHLHIAPAPAVALIAG
jgi:hypothetical protein